MDAARPEVDNWPGEELGHFERPPIVAGGQGSTNAGLWGTSWWSALLAVAAIALLIGFAIALIGWIVVYVLISLLVVVAAWALVSAGAGPDPYDTDYKHIDTKG